MPKHLQKYGNSHALILDKAILDAAGITPDTPLKVTPHAGAITIQAENVGIGPEGITDAINRLRPRYEQMLRNLAK